MYAGFIGIYIYIYRRFSASLKTVPIRYLSFTSTIKYVLSSRSDMCQI